MAERYFHNAQESKRGVLYGNKRCLSLPAGNSIELRV
jgi:hypothetical protein